MTLNTLRLTAALSFNRLNGLNVLNGWTARAPYFPFGGSGLTRSRPER